MSSHVTPDRERVAELAGEQTALRHIATLVARGVPAAQIFDAVAEQVGLLLGVEAAGVERFERNGEGTVVGRWGRLAGDAFPAGRRFKLDGNSPIIVNGHLWGALVAASSRPEPLPADAESRTAQFTELVATAISKVHASVEAARLGEEQAALRRVAIMVARGDTQERVEKLRSQMRRAARRSPPRKRALTACRKNRRGCAGLRPSSPKLRSLTTCSRRWRKRWRVCSVWNW
ncbi:GAF domain-containing protein [Candidatus Solirubrobacter pratensis]|uniref:GAF domain-containing protein n=1 Tax=Candidatus Solirubrobacter pratensis TaxID=1298857 RepID=UPI00040735CD|nr:GAF domain-containing protein [Candidatus Solirubrobacter pratensis]